MSVANDASVTSEPSSSVKNGECGASRLVPALEV